MKHTPHSNLGYRTYLVLAGIAAVIGLTSSYVTLRFFTLGLERLESDSLAREALVLSGILMVVVELAAFGLAALLPRHVLRGMRLQLIVCGLLLLGFETTTIYVTQSTLAQTTHAGVTASGTRIEALQAAIESRRAMVRSLRLNGERQSESSNSWARQLGAQSLREAMQAQALLAPLTTELAQLQATQPVSMQVVLGESGLLLYNVARSLLITLMGLVMFGAAGALWRAGREALWMNSNNSSTVATQPEASATEVATVSYSHGMSVAPRGWSASLPSLRFAVPMLLAASPAAYATGATVSAETVTNTVASTVATVARTVTNPDEASGLRYFEVRAAITTGRIKPSVRAILAEVGGATLAARRYLAQLALEGITVRAGQGWALAAASAQTS